MKYMITAVLCIATILMSGCENAMDMLPPSEPEVTLEGVERDVEILSLEEMRGDDNYVISCLGDPRKEHVPSIVFITKKSNEPGDIGEIAVLIKPSSRFDSKDAAAFLTVDATPNVELLEAEGFPLLPHVVEGPAGAPQWVSVGQKQSVRLSPENRAVIRFKRHEKEAGSVFGDIHLDYVHKTSVHSNGSGVSLSFVNNELSTVSNPDECHPDIWNTIEDDGTDLHPIVLNRYLTPEEDQMFRDIGKGVEPLTHDDVWRRILDAEAAKEADEPEGPPEVATTREVFEKYREFILNHNVDNIIGDYLRILDFINPSRFTTTNWRNVAFGVGGTDWVGTDFVRDLSVERAPHSYEEDPSEFTNRFKSILINVDNYVPNEISDALHDYARMREFWFDPQVQQVVWNEEERHILDALIEGLPYTIGVPPTQPLTGWTSDLADRIARDTSQHRPAE